MNSSLESAPGRSRSAAAASRRAFPTSALTLTPADSDAVAALEATLVAARAARDERPAPDVFAGALADLGVRATFPTLRSPTLFKRGVDAWLRRLASSGCSEATIRAYRNTIEDFLAWSRRKRYAEELFEEPSGRRVSLRRRRRMP